MRRVTPGAVYVVYARRSPLSPEPLIGVVAHEVDLGALRSSVSEVFGDVEVRWEEHALRGIPADQGPSPSDATVFVACHSLPGDEVAAAVFANADDAAGFTGNQASSGATDLRIVPRALGPELVDISQIRGLLDADGS